MRRDFNIVPTGVGAVVALVVLIVCIALIVKNGNANWLDLVAALAVARILP